MTLDQFDEVAEHMQAELIASMAADYDRGAEMQVITGRDPMDVTGNYKPGSTSAGIMVKIPDAAADEATRKRVHVRGSYYR